MLELIRHYRVKSRFLFLGWPWYSSTGFQNIDNITVDTYLADKPTLRKHYQELNGWEACKRMMDLLDVDNADGYFDQIAKMNSLKILAIRYEDMLSHPERFDNSTNEEVYEAFELLNNKVSLTTGQESKIESLVVDENYLQQCNEGQDQRNQLCIGRSTSELSNARCADRRYVYACRS